jgi:hypothetical protein
MLRSSPGMRVSPEAKTEQKTFAAAHFAETNPDLVPLICLPAARFASIRFGRTQLLWRTSSVLSVGSSWKSIRAHSRAFACIRVHSRAQSSALNFHAVKLIFTRCRGTALCISSEIPLASPLLVAVSGTWTCDGHSLTDQQPRAGNH